MKKLLVIFALLSGITVAQTTIVVAPGTKIKSYHASSSFAGSSTTDNAVLPGNATNKVLVTGIYVSCTQTTASTESLSIVKRSTADSGGTSTSMTAIPDDSSYVAAVSAPLSYTGTGPTAGTSLGTLDNYQISCPTTAGTSANDIYIFVGLLKPIVLNSASEEVAVNMGNAAMTGGVLTVTFAWDEVTVKP